MNIEILTYLEQNPKGNPNNPDDPNENEPLSEVQIAALETLYNDTNPFPQALRELLFLAGNYCYVLDYGPSDTQEEFQDEQREFINNAGITISRPYFALDCYSYGDTVLFVYLDEEDDPTIQHLSFETGEIMELDTLKNLINARIDRVKQGMNPF